MTISLDTNVIVDITRGHDAVRGRLRQSFERGETIVISTIALEELQFGALISRDPNRERDQLDDALVGVTVEPVTADDAIAIATYRADAERRGRRLSAYDGLIAGHAHARGWSVVTSDAKFVANAVDLRIENWREPDA